MRIDQNRLREVISQAKADSAACQAAMQEIRRKRQALNSLRARLNPGPCPIGPDGKPDVNASEKIQAEINALIAEIAADDERYDDLRERSTLSGTLANKARDHARQHDQLPPELED
ncbi:hypothetical protein Rvan_2044 [Rhodomicrobium vannielii ATCC 17100]|uniref:Uncharacterized protein n=2 Tax=Rhodomicrobium vannielii TaxID=1069 RepID=E3I1I1_RHOVT|nr:hypothetical protein Rvan_2044 [Rhodomicrobium vannielii ATCC 17100]